MNDTLISEFNPACQWAIIEAQFRTNATMSLGERKLFKLGFIAGARYGIDIAKRDIDNTGKTKETKA